MKRAAFAPFASAAGPTAAISGFAAGTTGNPDREDNGGGDEEQDDEGRKVHG